MSAETTPETTPTPVAITWPAAPASLPAGGAARLHQDVAWTYRQFREIIGPRPAREAMIGDRLRPERLVAAFRDDLYLGYLALRLDGVGPFTLGAADFRRRFGTLGGAARWAGWRVLARRERPDEIFIDGISVRPEARGLGVGALLLRRGEEIGRAAGKRVFRVRVRGENAAAAEFYRRQGFAREGTSEISWFAKPLGHSAVSTYVKPL